MNNYFKGLGVVLVAVVFILVCSCSGLQVTGSPKISEQAEFIKKDIGEWNKGKQCGIRLTREPVDIFFKDNHYIFLFVDNDCCGKCDISVVVQSLGKFGDKFEFALVWSGSCEEGEKALANARNEQQKQKGVGI